MVTRRQLIGGALSAPIALRIGAVRPVRAADGLKVVATFSILGDLVRNVGGDSIEVQVIVGPNGDAHTFEPSPEQIGWLADADLIFENGLGFEPWLNDMVSASESSATRVVATSAITPINRSEDEDADAHAEETVSGDEHADHDEEDDHEHGEFDPHVWQDVQNAILQLGAIRDALAAVDPVNASGYATNTEAYLIDLQALDAWVRAAVETLPAEERILFTSHDAFGYFSRAYGFTILGTALGASSTEAADPSAGEISRQIDAVTASGVPAIFLETNENDDLMEQIAEDAGVVLAPPLHGDALTEGDGPAANYIDLMRSNVTTIVTSLGGQVPPAGRPCPIAAKPVTDSPCQMHRQWMSGI